MNGWHVMSGWYVMMLNELNELDELNEWNEFNELNGREKGEDTCQTILLEGPGSLPPPARL